QQTTLSRGGSAATNARVDLLIARSEAGDCDLVARAQDDRGFLYIGSGKFLTSHAALPPLSDQLLRLTSYVEPITYTCVPPGSGLRIALDRDNDGAYDGDERIRGTNPADASSHP